MAKKEINPRNQQGFLFEDGSILIQINGVITGLSIDQSSLWQRGLGYEPFTIQKYKWGQKITLRSATYFEVAEFNPQSPYPLLLNIAGKGLVAYSESGLHSDSNCSDLDILMVPYTDPIFYFNTNILKK